MTDTLSPSERSKRMALVRSKGSKPEMIVRRLAQRLGYRFRLHSPDLPGKPDLVFPGRAKAVFVHGCFWHRHDGCKLARLPKSRLDFWEPKLEQNRTRDAANIAALEERGWGVMVVWECEVRNEESLSARLIEHLGSRLRKDREC